MLELISPIYKVMIKEQEAVTPSICSSPSKPILVIRSRPSTKRGDSARPRVTFSESTFKKEASSSKESTPIQNGGPIASNMTFGEFEAMVKRRMDAPKREDSSSRLNLRPQSVKLSSKGFNISERRNNALKPTISFQKQERLTSAQNGMRSSFIEYPVSKVHQNDLCCEIEANSGPRDRSNLKVISKSFRESFTKDFKIGTFCPFPQKGMSRVRSSGKFAFGNMITTTIEDKDCLGIHPEVGKRSKYFS